MATRWILDTDTKGTGARVVPLDERAETPPGRPVIVAPERRRRAAEPARAGGPRRFRVVDVMTRRPLAADASARGTVELLKGVRSLVDVSIEVWEERAGKWQQLTHREQRMLWDRAVAERGG